jgi:hypothetical protein
MIEYLRVIGLHIWHSVLCDVGSEAEETVQDLNITISEFSVFLGNSHGFMVYEK